MKSYKIIKAACIGTKLQINQEGERTDSKTNQRGRLQNSTYR